MNTSDKFKLLIKELGFTSIKEFSEELGVSQARLVDVMREKQKLPEDLLLKLITKYNVNANWLVAGIGGMFIGINPTNDLTASENALLEDYRESNEQGKEAIEKTAKALSAISALEALKVA